MHPKQAIFDNLFSWLKKNVSSLNSDWTVAEFGVGRTGFSSLYAKHFKRVIGIDIEDYSSHHPGIDFVLATNNSIDIQNGTVDLVVSHSVLEHVEDLHVSLSELNRITKRGGLFFLTVSPLYFSGYGSHMKESGRRFDNWEHLIKGEPYYLTQNPLPHAKTSGHYLNKLSCEMFLQHVGKQPWNIVRFDRTYETKPIPDEVDKDVASELDLLTKEFRFVGRKTEP